MIFKKRRSYSDIIKKKKINYPIKNAIDVITSMPVKEEEMKKAKNILGKLFKERIKRDSLEWKI